MCFNISKHHNPPKDHQVSLRCTWWWVSESFRSKRFRGQWSNTEEVKPLGHTPWPGGGGAGASTGDCPSNPSRNLGMTYESWRFAIQVYHSPWSAWTILSLQHHSIGFCTGESTGEVPMDHGFHVTPAMVDVEPWIVGLPALVHDRKG